MAGFFLAARVLAARGRPPGLDGVADVAGLPLLLLAAGAVSLAMLPLAHAMSRASSGAPTASPSTSRAILPRSSPRCAGSARRTSPRKIRRLVQWLFYSHPPMRERIAAAQAFKH